MPPDTISVTTEPATEARESVQETVAAQETAPVAPAEPTPPTPPTPRLAMPTETRVRREFPEMTDFTAAPGEVRFKLKDDLTIVLSKSPTSPTTYNARIESESIDWLSAVGLLAAKWMSLMVAEDMCVQPSVAVVAARAARA